MESRVLLIQMLPFLRDRNRIFKVKREVLSTLLFFNCFFILAQSNQSAADSLRQVLDEKSLTLEDRITTLGDIIAVEPDPSNDIIYADEILNLSGGSNEFFEDIHYALLSQGNAYKQLGNTVAALDKYFEAADLSKSNRYEEGVAQAYATIAGTYKGTGNFELAVKYYRQASKIFLEIPDSLSLGLININLGYGYYSIGEYDSAKQLTLLGIEISKRLYPVVLDYAKGNLALIDIKLGNQYAYDSLDAVITDLKLKGDDFAVSDYLSQLSGILKDQGQVNSAIAAGEESLVLSKKLGLKEQIRDASESLCDLYSIKGDYEKALKYQTQYIIYKDSINNIESVNQIANLRTEFEIGQAEAAMSAERQTQQVINVALIFGLGLLMVFGVAQYRNSRQRMQINQVLRDQKAELETQKSELEAVNRTKDRFFSIISHDLRGPVNAFHGVSRMIKFFVQNKQIDQLEVLAEEIDKSVDRLSSLLDNLLNWAVQQQGEFPYVPEKIEIKTLADDLVDVFTTMAKSKQIALSSSVTEDIHAWADRNTTMTIIRNLVSNALKFTPRSGHVTISAQTTDECVEIEVHDNGVGIPKDKLGHLFELNEENSTWGTEGEKGLGLGLQLVHEFVELNQGQIIVNSQDGKGTTFTVRLPTYDLQEIQEEVE